MSSVINLDILIVRGFIKIISKSGKKLFHCFTTSTTFSFKVGQTLFQSGTKTVISKWVNVYLKQGNYFKVQQKLFQNGGKCYFKVGHYAMYPFILLIIRHKSFTFFVAVQLMQQIRKFLYNFFSILLLFRPRFFILIIQKVVRTIFNINLFFTIQYGNMYSFYKQCFV